jgi:hypothetical protein
MTRRDENSLDQEQDANVVIDYKNPCHGGALIAL